MNSLQIVREAAGKAGWKDEDILDVLCEYIDNQAAPDVFADHVRKCADEDEALDAHDRMIDRHSVNCYFCGKQVDERDCVPADYYNGDDGGNQCPDCTGNLLRVIFEVTAIFRDYKGDDSALAVRHELEKLLPTEYRKAVDAAVKAVIRNLRPEPEAI